MAKCDVRLIVDQPRAAYRPDDTITGEVEVTVHADTQCTALTVTPEWFTHGRGNHTSGQATGAAVTLFRGAWQPGDTARYPFTVHVPNGPISYEGHFLHVDWRLVANADVPNAFDARAEAPFRLLPSPRPMPGYSPGAPLLGSPVQLDPRTSGLALGCFTAFLLMFVIPGSIAALVGLLQVGGLGTPWIGGTLLLWGLLFAGIPLGALFFLWSPRMAERLLGPVTVTLEPSPARAGDTVQCRLSCVTARGVRIDRIEATLLGRERVMSGTAKHSVTHTHELERHPVTLVAARRTLRPGEPLMLDWTYTLPTNAAPSFHGNDNHLEWIVEITIRIPLWPDWARKIEIPVVPGGEP